MKRLIALPLAALLVMGAGDPASEAEHVVASGETLSTIAQRAGVPMVVIAEANGLSQPYVIKVGQKLAIPRQRTHEVKQGETGFGLSYQYGVAYSQIALANGIAEDSILKVGQKLIIPTMI
ncbi:MAG: LysM peptidoglycan-binding domain-containing protein, partial [Proteobacteria bacterium]